MLSSSYTLIAESSAGVECWGYSTHSTTRLLMEARSRFMREVSGQTELVGTAHHS